MMSLLCTAGLERGDDICLRNAQIMSNFLFDTVAEIWNYFGP